MDISEVKKRLNQAVSDRQTAEKAISEALSEIKQTVIELNELAQIETISNDNNSDQNQNILKNILTAITSKTCIVYARDIALIVFILGILAFFTTWLFYGVETSSKLSMTAEEKKVTAQAFEIVTRDIADGKIKSSRLALEAISAELPESVRENVIKAIGTPALNELPARLETILKRISTIDNTCLLLPVYTV